MTTTQDQSRQRQSAIKIPLVDQQSGDLTCPLCHQVCLETATPTHDIGGQEKSVVSRICRRHRQRSIILPVPIDLAPADSTPVEIDVDGESITAAIPDHD